MTVDDLKKDWFQATLWITGFECMPEEITARVGLTPSGHLLTGDTAPVGILVHENQWWLDASHLFPHTPEEQLLALVAVLEPHTERIAALADKAKLAISVTAYQREENCSITIPAHCVLVVAACMAELRVMRVPRS